MPNLSHNFQILEEVTLIIYGSIFTFLPDCACSDTQTVDAGSEVVDTKGGFSEQISVFGAHAL